MNKNLITTIALVVVLILGVGYALYEYTDIFDDLGKSEKVEKVEKPSESNELNENTRLFEGFVVKDQSGDLSVLGLKLKSKEDLSSYEGEYVVMKGEVKDEEYFEVISIDKGVNHQETISDQSVINLEGEVNESGTLLTSEIYGEFLLTGDNSKYAGEMMLFSIAKKDDAYSILSAQKLEIVSGAFKIVDPEAFTYKVGNVEFSANSDISNFFEEGVDTIAFITEVDGKKVFYKTAPATTE